MREILIDREVYLVEYTENMFRLLCPVAEIKKVVNVLHSELLRHI